jgi:hypothetical protein
MILGLQPRKWRRGHIFRLQSAKTPLSNDSDLREFACHSDRSMIVRRGVTIVAGLCVCAGSFFATLRVIDSASRSTGTSIAEQSDQPSGLEALKTALIYDAYSLSVAAAIAKLRNSDSLKGVVDSLQRLSDDRVIAGGWAVDTRGDGTPVKIVAFARGKQVLEAETSGERPDVTAAYHLPAHIAKNTKFDLTVPCNRSDALVIAIATTSDTYASLKATTCP